MVKTAFKNYFKYILYVFIAMGIIYLAVIVSVFGLYRGAVYIDASLAGDALQRLWDYAGSYFSGATFAQVFSPTYIRDFVNGFAELLEDTLANITVLLGAGVVLVTAACKLARSLCRWVIRRTTLTKDSIRGFFLFIVRYAFQLAYIVAFAVLSYMWIFSAPLLLVASYFLMGIQDLISTWFIHFRKVEFRQIFNGKNLFRLLGTDFLVLMLNVLFCALIGWIFNPLFALLIGVPLIVYTHAVTDVTAVNYFRKCLESGKLKLKTAPAGQAQADSAITDSEAITEDESDVITEKEAAAAAETEEAPSNL